MGGFVRRVVSSPVVQPVQPKPKPKPKQSNLTHGAGGKLLNPDGTVNKEATRDNVAHLNK